MNTNKVSLLSLMILLCAVPMANAASNSDGTKYRSDWGLNDGSITSLACSGSGADAGFSKSHTGEEPSVGRDEYWHKWLAKHFTDDQKGDWSYGAVYYIAHEMSEHGYKFCKTVVQGDRDSCTSDSTFLMYYGLGDCLWICEKGYYGDGCTSKTIDTTQPDTSVLKRRKSYANGKIHPLVSTKDMRTGGNIKTKIPMFFSSHKVKCSDGNQVNLLKMKKKQEHDVVLAIKTITDSDSLWKFTLSPMVIRSGGAKGCHGVDDTAWPMIKWAGQESANYCPSAGFIYDATKSACIANVPLAESQAAEEAASNAASELQQAIADAEKDRQNKLNLLCPTFVKENYNQKIHDFIESKFGETTCYNLKCKDSESGFYEADMDSTTVIPCNKCAPADSKSDMLYGVDSDGYCVECGLGKYFDKSTKKCVVATAITKEQMKGEISSTGSLKKTATDRCWTKSTPAEYRECLNLDKE